MQRDFANILDIYAIWTRLMHFLLDTLAQPLKIIYISAALFLIHPVLADENKTEAVNLESVKNNWVDELNNAEYMQRGQGSFRQNNIPSPNCDRHGCYNNGSNKSSW